MADKSTIHKEFGKYLQELAVENKVDINQKDAIGKAEGAIPPMNKTDKAFLIVERLLEIEYVNPYDVLELGFEASDVEIKSKFRQLSTMVHPDKCKHPKAAEAFHVVDKAYKTLMDVDKRRTYQRVMREARESVEANRLKEN